MPVLDSQENKQKVFLPSTNDKPEEERAWVEIDTSKLRPSDVLDIENEQSEARAGVSILTKRIKSWNYTDAQGAQLPIDFDNVARLSMQDFAFLSKMIPKDFDGLTQDEKKT